jgi:hypothetical protein
MRAAPAGMRTRLRDPTCSMIPSRINTVWPVSTEFLSMESTFALTNAKARSCATSADSPQSDSASVAQKTRMPFPSDNLGEQQTWHSPLDNQGVTPTTLGLLLSATADAVAAHDFEQARVVGQAELLRRSRDVVAIERCQIDKCGSAQRRIAIESRLRYLSSGAERATPA